MGFEFGSRMGLDLDMGLGLDRACDDTDYGFRLGVRVLILICSSTKFSSSMCICHQTTNFLLCSKELEIGISTLN